MAITLNSLMLPTALSTALPQPLPHCQTQFWRPTLKSDSSKEESNIFKLESSGCSDDRGNEISLEKVTDGELIRKEKSKLSDTMQRLGAGDISDIGEAPKAEAGAREINALSLESSEFVDSPTELAAAGDDTVKVEKSTFFGAMLFQRGISGTR